MRKNNSGCFPISAGLVPVGITTGQLPMPRLEAASPSPFAAGGGKRGGRAKGGASQSSQSVGFTDPGELGGVFCSKPNS